MKLEAGRIWKFDGSQKLIPNLRIGLLYKELAVSFRFQRSIIFADALSEMG